MLKKILTYVRLPDLIRGGKPDKALLCRDSWHGGMLIPSPVIRASLNLTRFQWNPYATLLY
jgi:hypothetical protein